MPFSIVRDNIVKVPVEAIVNAANNRLKAGHGVCGAIFAAAGKQELQKECDEIGYCKTGDAVITKGYGLKASYVIHTVGPIWNGGGNGEEALLRSCYQKSLQLAASRNIQSIAFPIISSGIYGYPKEQAFQIAIEEIKTFLKNYEDDMEVVLVVFDKQIVQIGSSRHIEIQSYINDKYVDMIAKTYARPSRPKLSRLFSPKEMVQEDVLEDFSYSCETTKSSKKKSLEDCLNTMEETFSQRLLRMIDETGKKDSEIYKKANIDRKHFSKIRSNMNYMPSKKTVIAFAIALELDLDNAKDLLSSAGYALSRSSKFDIIIEYYLENKIYDIFEINEVLFAFEQPILN